MITREETEAQRGGVPCQRGGAGNETQEAWACRISVCTQRQLLRDRGHASHPSLPVSVLGRLGDPSVLQPGSHILVYLWTLRRGGGRSLPWVQAPCSPLGALAPPPCCLHRLKSFSPPFEGWLLWEHSPISLSSPHLPPVPSPTADSLPSTPVSRVTHG